jgi:hypothetical protein
MYIAIRCSKHYLILVTSCNLDEIHGETLKTGGLCGVHSPCTWDPCYIHIDRWIGQFKYVPHMDVIVTEYGVLLETVCLVDLQ